MNTSNNIKEAYQHFAANNYATAWNICKKVLTHNPNQLDCHALLGMLCNKAKRYSDAEKHLQTCLPNHSKPHFILTELASTFIYQKRFEEANIILEESMKINNNYEKTRIQKAKLLKLTNNISEAISILQQLVTANPKSESALNNLGSLLVGQQKFTEAMKLFKKAISINPKSSYTYKNIALVELKKGNYREAMTFLIKAHKLNPTENSVLLKMGQLLDLKQNRKKANELYERIIKTDSNNDEAMMLAGINYWHLGEFEKAANYFETVHNRHPEYTEAFYRLLRCKLDMADWTNWEENRKQLIKILEQDLNSTKPLACSPYDLHYYNIPDELQHWVMQRFSQKYNSFKSQVFSFTNRKHKKIRIGYLSPDFRSHALGMSVYKMFQHHNHEQFEVYVFSQYVPNPDDLFHNEIKNTADLFFNIQGFSTEAAAQLIYDNEIDILVDFGGYSTNAQPGILKLKPAPVQVFMFGQPDTLAMPEVDFFISDTNLIDEKNKKYYSEKIVNLPYGFICSPIEPSDTIITRKQMNLPDDAFVFSSFCSPYKYDPKLFGVWMQLLKQVENSVLWLLSNENKTFENNILKQAKTHGINNKQIVFAQPLPIAEHLQRMKLADLFLDTQYYSSCSSASHALMSRLPVLTLRGDTNASRQGATVCHAAGLDDMICHNMAEYFEKACQLATSAIQLYSLKKRLNKKVNDITHFNLPLNVQYIEQAFTEMWNNYEVSKT